MTDLLKLTPTEELIADLNARLNDMTREAHIAISQEEERSRQWCRDRWQRMNDETRDIRAKRDAMLKAWADAQPQKPIIVESNLSRAIKEARGGEAPPAPFRGFA